MTSSKNVAQPEKEVVHVVQPEKEVHVVLETAAAAVAEADVIIIAAKEKAIAIEVEEEKVPAKVETLHHATTSSDNSSNKPANPPEPVPLEMDSKVEEHNVFVEALHEKNSGKPEHDEGMKKHDDDEKAVHAVASGVPHYASDVIIERLSPTNPFLHDVSVEYFNGGNRPIEITESDDEELLRRVLMMEEEAKSNLQVESKNNHGVTSSSSSSSSSSSRSTSPAPVHTNANVGATVVAVIEPTAAAAAEATTQSAAAAAAQTDQYQRALPENEVQTKATYAEVVAQTNDEQTKPKVNKVLRRMSTTSSSSSDVFDIKSDVTNKNDREVDSAKVNKNEVQQPMMCQKVSVTSSSATSSSEGVTNDVIKDVDLKAVVVDDVIKVVRNQQPETEVIVGVHRKRDSMTSSSSSSSSSSVSSFEDPPLDVAPISNSFDFGSLRRGGGEEKGGGGVEGTPTSGGGVVESKALIMSSPQSPVSLDDRFFRKLNTSYTPVYRIRKQYSMTQTDISNDNFQSPPHPQHPATATTS